MDVIGFVAENLLIWLLGSIVFSAIYYMVVGRKLVKKYNAVKNDPFGALGDTLQTLGTDPDKIVKPAARSYVKLVAIYAPAAIFWGLFSISLLINIVIYIMSKFWPQA